MLIGRFLDKELKGDRGIWLILVVMSLASLLAVYSATGTMAFLEKNGNTAAYLYKHAGLLVLGVLFTYLCHLVHYLKYAKLAPYLLLLAIPLLAYTLKWGDSVNNAYRWIEIPFIGITFQTSDFAKLALIIYMARTISLKQDLIKNWKAGFLPLILPVIIICGLIAPANLSTALILFFTCAVMMFVGRVNIKHLGMLAICGILMLGTIIAVGKYYPDNVRVATWSSRISAFMGESDEDYQVTRAKIAIANGQWTGVGPGNSFQRNYLPYPYADFIYAIICEEYGLLGGTAVVLLYLFLFYRCVRLVTLSPRAFGAILAMGLSLLLMVQAFVNIAVSVNLLPVTGVTLPMISMGGTSIVFISMTLGIILSVSRHIQRDTDEENNEVIADEQTS
jgi:cell division protein FtsW